MLIECPECQKNISPDARICPHCGFPDVQYHTEKAAEETKRIFENRPVDEGRFSKCPACGKYGRKLESCSIGRQENSAKFYADTSWRCLNCGHIFK